LKINFFKSQKTKKVLLFCQDVDRGVDRNGKAYSQIIDPLGDYLEGKKIKVIRARSFDSRIALSKTYKINANLKKEKKWSKILYFFETLLKCYKNKKNKQKVINYRVFKKIFKKYKPQLIISISPSQEMCLAARRTKTAIIEITHGFGLPASCPVYGKMARTNESSLREPNIFICFDSTTFETRRDGDLNRKCKTYLVNKLTFEDASMLKLKLEKEKTILITLQWGYQGEVEYLKEIIEDGILPSELKTIIREDSTKNWLVKFHPLQARTPEKWARCKAYIKDNLMTGQNKVFDVTHYPIDNILKRCGLHITMMSGAAYEAAFLGVYTIALCPSVQPGKPNSEFYKDLENAGLLKKIPIIDPNLKSIIEKSLLLKTKKYSSDASQNVGELVMDLIQNIR